MNFGKMPDRSKNTVPLLFVCFLTLTPAFAQQAKEVRHQSQQWIGYMTATKIADRFSWWNDVHLVPDGFFVLRTGLTHYFPERASITAGYAYLRLPSGTLTRDLKRTEHRPWGQLIVNSPLPGQWSHLMRIRYDARFRQNIVQGQLRDGFGFNHRLRFLSSFRRRFPRLSFGDEWIPFINISDEVLLNFGKEIVFNHLDQNRVTATLGLLHKRMSIQVGYMNGYVQLSSGYQFVMNHTAILWITHNLDGRRLISPTP